MTDLDFAELLRRLREGRVEFVLIGGAALNAWGVLRGTKDLDIVAAPDGPNLARLARVAAAAGGQVQAREALVSSALGIASLLEAGDRVLIETDLGPLDVVRGLPGVPPFAELRARAVAVELLGETVLVCDVQDLRAMKRAAGRLRDLADLEDLDAAHGEEPGAG